MSELNVISRTQHIVVDAASSSVAVINAGPAGPGAPSGGLTGQVLMKLSDADYDFAWVTPT
jgi:hypothetical protein